MYRHSYSKLEWKDGFELFIETVFCEYNELISIKTSLFLHTLINVQLLYTPLGLTQLEMEPTRVTRSLIWKS